MFYAKLIKIKTVELVPLAEGEISCHFLRSKEAKKKVKAGA